MSAVDHVSAYLRVQYQHKRKVTLLRRDDAPASEQEQKRRGIEARKRLLGKPLQMTIPVIVENVKTQPVTEEFYGENPHLWTYHDPAPYDTCMPYATPDLEVWMKRFFKINSVSFSEIRSDTRTRRLVNLRREIAEHLRHDLHWSFTRIGRYMWRDHSSILSLLKRRKGQINHRGEME